MAAVEIGLVLLFLLLLAVITIAALFFWGLKYAIALALNGIIGFFALYAVKVWLLPELIINVWSVLFVAIGGLLGMAIVMVLHLVGWWF